MVERGVRADDNRSDEVTGIPPAPQACARPPAHELSGAGYPAPDRQNFAELSAIAPQARVLPRSPKGAESGQRAPHCYPPV